MIVQSTCDKRAFGSIERNDPATAQLNFNLLLISATTFLKLYRSTHFSKLYRDIVLDVKALRVPLAIPNF